MTHQYFLVNDTRYDNHHGSLMVVRNLQQAMQKRGWHCVGSLAVSSSARHLANNRKSLQQAQLVVVNGEGSLHHDSRNATRLLAICRELQKTHPVALINTVWQENDLEKWRPVLQNFCGIYTRDKRSQQALTDAGVRANYAPDLTFYDYPQFPQKPTKQFGCTDSVINSWTESALELCRNNDEIDFITLFTGRIQYTRGPRDWHKLIKYPLYPWLWKHLHLKVPARYRSLPFAISDTHEFLANLSCYRAVCVARYHALCFAIQQKIPFLAARSNSHKSEALLEEAGLPLDTFLINYDDLPSLGLKLQHIAGVFPEFAEATDSFRKGAKEKIAVMIDDITAGR